MTIAKTAPAAKGGYWLIQIVNRDRREIGRGYVCHARDDAQAQSIAGHLAGAARGVAGYDYHPIDDPHGPHARVLSVGACEPVHEAAAWAALRAPRRST